MDFNRKGKNIIQLDLNKQADELCDDKGYDDDSTVKCAEEVNLDSNTGDINVDHLNANEVSKMTFSRLDDAELFYNLYARASGFSIRRSDQIQDEDGKVIYRKWVCSREGKRQEKWTTLDNRQREAKAITRIGCHACMRIKYERSSGVYMVSKFVNEHNHNMASQSCISFLRSHRNVADDDHALAQSMKRVGIRTSQIMKFFALQAGGYENVGFVSKDLYNHIDKERRNEVIDGDAEGVLGYLRARQDADPMLYFKFDVDSENRLRRLFWADSKCRTEYMLFGDVLVFDTTYKTNAYRKPLVVLGGVNNHFMTSIFGIALLSDETNETYEWVLETLVDAMNGKSPISIMTDGDNAMRNAIKKVFPGAVHRLCGWHLERNAASNVKSKGFLAEFATFLYDIFTPEEFEEKWENMVQRHGLQQNEWVRKIHRRRHLWAETYLKGYFFAGMRSTQRCEKMNAVLNTYLKDKLKLFEFVRAFDLALAALRFSVAKAEATTENTEMMQVTQFPSIEKQIANVYTRAIFKKVIAELKKQAAILQADIIHEGQSKRYQLTEWSNPSRRWIVTYNHHLENQLECSCMLFESKGIPCCHIFCVIIKEGLKEIPLSCINMRWSRQITRGTDTAVEIQAISPLDKQISRFGLLSVECTSMCYYASQTDEGFTRVRSMICKEAKEVRDMLLSKIDKNEKTPGSSHNSKPSCFGVLDPKYTRAKGDHASSSKRKSVKRGCSICGGNGHNKRTCPTASQRLPGMTDTCDRVNNLAGDSLDEADGSILLSSIQCNPYDFLSGWHQSNH